MKISETIKVAVDLNRPCLLVGNHGTGKSFEIRQAAKKAKKVLHRIIVTQETTPEDLIYSYELKKAETKTVEKELLKAVKAGDWLVLEELNMASPAVLTLLNGLLETDPESRYLRFKDKEIIPHKDFRLFATSNPTSYSGANRMNDALLSRFLINKVQPDYKFFISLISKKFKNSTITKESRQFVSALAKAKKNYEIYISPRELLMFAELRNNGYTRQESVGFILDRFYDEDPEIIADIAMLFEVESTRDDIQILNEVELKKLIADKTEEIRYDLDEANQRLEKLEKYKGLVDQITTKLSEEN